MKKLNTNEFIKRSKNLHGNRYSYDKCFYVNKRTKVILKCNNCNKYFSTCPHRHIHRKHGCPDCGLLFRKTRTKTTEEFIQAAKLVHSDCYNYSLTIYVSTEEKVKITCPKHGVFKQTPHSHLQGSSCPVCAKTGFKVNKPGILYYLSINNGQAYKVGITNHSVKKRFDLKDRNKIKILKTWYFINGYDCYSKEQQIINQFKCHKYKGPKLLRNGNTELFISDVLLLDFEKFLWSAEQDSNLHMTLCPTVAR